ncbi:metallophosphoesterase [Nocardioides sp. R-C-SC26]|uniref:metallophosphoesterase n=1 Tax=Nocardioides sp. R-C-SC26 TaxID=2870414 RepID=UPI001E365EDC|nr:metallophosphoesterase [Nocardioides sp. R-C-SC26]
MPLTSVPPRAWAYGGLGAMLAGAGVVGYAAHEARCYTLRHVDLPILPDGARPLRVLHLSDIHLVPTQQRKLDWLRGLASLEPDLVVDTGDNLAHRDSVPALADALAPLMDRPGVFVHGSNDYFEPKMRNPLRYLLPDTGRRYTDTPHLPWRELSQRFVEAGWLDLTNRRGQLTIGDLRLAFGGVDDPHLGYDRLETVTGAVEAGGEEPPDVRLAVAHAPYLRVLDAYARDGYDAILAGHTHGGQVCLPFTGRALTTNCDLEPARARGLHRHPADTRPGDPGSSWLHISAGIGSNPFVRLRLACRPEATLLRLVSRG